MTKTTKREDIAERDAKTPAFVPMGEDRAQRFTFTMDRAEAASVINAIWSAALASRDEGRPMQAAARFTLALAMARSMERRGAGDPCTMDSLRACQRDSFAFLRSGAITEAQRASVARFLATLESIDLG